MDSSELDWRRWWYTWSNIISKVFASLATKRKEISIFSMKLFFGFSHIELSLFKIQPQIVFIQWITLPCLSSFRKKWWREILSKKLFRSKCSFLQHFNVRWFRSIEFSNLWMCTSSIIYLILEKQNCLANIAMQCAVNCLHLVCGFGVISKDNASIGLSEVQGFENREHLKMKYPRKFLVIWIIYDLNRVDSASVFLSTYRRTSVQIVKV